MSHKRKQKSKTKERIKTSLWFDSYRQNQNEIKLSFVGDGGREKKVAGKNQTATTHSGGTNDDVRKKIFWQNSMILAEFLLRRLSLFLRGRINGFYWNKFRQKKDQKKTNGPLDVFGSVGRARQICGLF